MKEPLEVSHSSGFLWAIPPVDVVLLGWNCRETLMQCYQQPDEATMLAVVLGGAELREKKA